MHIEVKVNVHKQKYLLLQHKISRITRMNRGCILPLCHC